MPKKPNFFIVGAPKSGTTSLAEWLGEHPYAFVPNTKEPDYFYPNGLFSTLSAYEALFEEVGSHHIAVGEGSWRYMLSGKALQAAEFYTAHSARYIMILRNPVDMCESLHAQRLYSLNEDIEDFESAWHAQFHRCCHLESLPATWYSPETNLYGEICKIGKHVSRVQQFVPSERLLILFLEDLKENPRREWLKLLAFLGLPDDERKNFESRNSRKRWRSRLLARCWVALYRIRRATGLPSLRIGKQLSAINRQRTRSKTGIRKEFRQELEDYFAEDIELLETITSRDLSHWRSTARSNSS